jgi:hypothetical protein
MTNLATKVHEDTQRREEVNREKKGQARKLFT